MNEQLSLFGRQPKRPIAAGEPIYFAALPGDQLATVLPPLVARLRSDFGVHAPAIPWARLHVSVLGVGIAHQMSEADIATAVSVTKTFALTPFQLSFTTVMSYRRGPTDRAAPVVLVPDPQALDVPALSARLAQAMIDQAVDPRGSPGGNPHMTLLYDRARVPPTRLPQPIVVRIHSVALVHSHWGHGRYTILAETPAKQPW